MIRINLLPPEILEKRRFEHQIVYVLLVGAVFILAVGIAYTWFAWQGSERNRELQSNLALESSYQKQAEAFKIFEDKEQSLQRRAEIAERALDGRADWGRIANELSLVLPPDVWLERIEAEEYTLKLEGRALDNEVDIPDVGHKAVAKTLVRLGDLELLSNVWLTSSKKGSATAETKLRPFIVWGIQSDVNAPRTLQQDTGVPAPPTGTGQ